MARAARSLASDSTARRDEPAAAPSMSRRLARGAMALETERLPVAVVDKVKLAFIDFLSCALDARDLPWSRQAIQMACRDGAGRVPIIGTSHCAGATDAAFVNGVLGHGLVREDMHTAAISHFGVVVFPTLLSLCALEKTSGADFIAAAVAGYEAGGSLGRALIDREIAAHFRPTGITGPIAGAVAAGRLMRLDEDAVVSAIGLAANCTGGLNEWALAGGEEMFFHPGFAARSAVTAALLASVGARASDSALDGMAGLFAGFGRRDRLATMAPFARDRFEIMAVYHKPAPACNYAQTACQAALAVTAQPGFDADRIAAIEIRASETAVAYPGCAFEGPFTGPLQAKMSIPFSVTATLAHGRIAEENYRDLCDPLVLKLIARATLDADPAFTAAYPGAQGAEVRVRRDDGAIFAARLDDLVPADAALIRARFRAASVAVLGAAQAARLEDFIDWLERQDDLSALAGLLVTPQRSSTHHG